MFNYRFFNNTQLLSIFFQVFSSAKYPCSEYKKQPCLFSSNSDDKLKTLTHNTQQIDEIHPTFDDNLFKEKLQFYNVNVRQDRLNQEVEDMGEGLGRLPQHVDSVSTLLLFNTSENP